MTLPRWHALQAALADAEAATAMAPRSKEAPFAKAMALLDLGRWVAAITAFERVLQVDRFKEGLPEWLLRAHSRARHHGR
jgi:hypothetical protein